MLPAELPLTVQLVSVGRAVDVGQAAAAIASGVAADGAVGQRVVVTKGVQKAAAESAGGVSADGAVGQRGLCRSRL